MSWPDTRGVVRAEGQHWEAATLDLTESRRRWGQKSWWHSVGPGEDLREAARSLLRLPVFQARHEDGSDCRE